MIIYVVILIMMIFVFLFESSIAFFFINYIYENDLENLLKYNSKISLSVFQEKRYLASSRILLLLLLFPLLNFNFIYFFSILALAYFVYKKPYYDLSKEFKINLSLVKYQFPIWLRQIQVLLHNNNVLMALKLSLDSAPNILVNDLNVLIESLSNDPNNIEIFNEFMDYFKISEINQAMKLLYRTYIVDKDESSKQLNRMISTTTKWIRIERNNKQETSLFLYEWIGIMPLIGVTIVFIVVMASLVSSLFTKGVSV